MTSPWKWNPSIVPTMANSMPRRHSIVMDNFLSPESGEQMPQKPRLDKMDGKPEARSMGYTQWMVRITGEPQKREAKAADKKTD